MAINVIHMSIKYTNVQKSINQTKNNNNTNSPTLLNEKVNFQHKCPRGVTFLTKARLSTSLVLCNSTTSSFKIPQAHWEIYWGNWKAQWHIFWWASLIWALGFQEISVQNVFLVYNINALWTPWSRRHSLT